MGGMPGQGLTLVSMLQTISARPGRVARAHSKMRTPRGESMLSRISLALGVALATSVVGLAQVVEETRTTTTPAGTTQIRRVSQLIGSNVQLQGVPNYGKVEDVVLDNNGGIGYLVVAKG